MRKLIAIFIFFVLLLGMDATQVFAQQKVVQYTRDFVFRDGIYLSFYDYKKNRTIPASSILSDYNKNNRDFFDKVLSKNTFTYTDSSGKDQTIKSSEVWGYCSNGVIYINHGTGFNRVMVIGSISHFLATTQVRTGNQDPFYNDQLFGPSQQYMYVSSQFILDFETGSIMDFNMGNMEIILSRDEALYKEFLALKKKQKRDSIFLYLRKYNEKHPIYFPE